MKEFPISMYSKNVEWYLFVRSKPGTIIIKANFNFWVIVWCRNQKWAIQIFNPKLNVRPNLEFRFTQEQTITILKNIIKREAIEGQCAVIKSLARN